MKPRSPLLFVATILLLACGFIAPVATQIPAPPTAGATELPIIPTTEMPPPCEGENCEPTVTPTNCPEGCPALTTPQLIPFPPDSIAARHEFYPLIGQHASLDCQTCHTTEQYEGTPNTCIACHNSVTPANHYVGECASCHTPEAWQSVFFDHQVVGATDCLSCHAVDAPINHFAGQCVSCHSTLAWLPATFDHTLAGATDCLSCHTPDAPVNHFAGQCSACHVTLAWLPATFDHALAGATDCLACHTADAPVNHYTGQCSTCHLSTTTWTGASYPHVFPINHEGANGECALCHVNTTATWTCSVCHNDGEMLKEHNEEGISNISNCLQCHPTGQEGDGDGEGGGDDD